MRTERYIRTQQIEIQECERCKGSHELPIEVVLDRPFDVLGLMTMRTETHDVIVKCPETQEDIVISVPVSLSSLETVVNIRRKG